MFHFYNNGQRVQCYNPIGNTNREEIALTAIVKEFKLDADATTAWKAWTESGQVAQWFAPAAEVEPVAGGKYEIYFNPADRNSMSTKGCKVVEADPTNRLVFEWKGPDQFQEIMNETERLTIVEVTFQADGTNGTRLHLSHTGWGDNAEWEEARNWHVRAWDDVLSSLKKWLEGKKG